MKKRFKKSKSKKISTAILNVILCMGLVFGNVGSNTSIAAEISAEQTTGASEDAGEQILVESETEDMIPEATETKEEQVTQITEEPVGEMHEITEINVMPLATAGTSVLKSPAELALSGKTANAVTIDGNLAEGIWATADSYSIEQFTDSTINNNASSFQTAWDDTNFYIAIRVVDSTVITESTGILSNNIYENDGFEIFLDGNNSKGRWDPNDFHIFVQNDSKLDVWGGTSGTWGKTTELEGKMEHKVVKTTDGFVLEMSVALEALGVIPKDGKVMGLGVTNNDNDNPTQPARKEITWNAGQNGGKPATWGTVCMYDTRKPLLSTYGTPVVKSGVENWDASIWDFSDDYSLSFANIPGATVKFASLSNYDGFYLSMFIEGAGVSAVPFVEALLSGDNKRSGGAKQEYGCIMQWNPVAAESWQQLNITGGTNMNQTNFKKIKYNLGDGSYAFVLMIPWNQLSAPVEGSSVPRENYSLMSFSVATGNNGKIADGDNTRWTDSQAWWANALDFAATLLINNPNIIELDPNVAPEGNKLYSYSIPQGGNVSGKVKVTDANLDNVLTYTLEDGYDSAVNGAVTVNSATGEWTYTTPNTEFVTAEGATGVNFWIVTSDGNGGSCRTRVEVKVEYTPTNLIYYVDGDTGKDSNDGLSYKKAFKSIKAAHDKSKPGDTVLIYESTTPYGWYSDEEYVADDSLYSTVRNGTLIITRSGLPEAPITYKAAEGETPVLKGNGVWHTLVISANYINVEGLTVRGKADELTYKDAYAAFWGKMAASNDPEYSSDWGYSVGEYNTNGIEVEPVSGHKVLASGVTDPNVSIPHHIKISNCVAEYLPGTGIGGNQCDYVTIENCNSVNNCWWGMYGNSGLGFITIVDIDDNTEDYKMVIRDNISAGNRHFIPWKSGTVRLSDGNGIIMDTCDEHGHNYHGKTLIANNLVYENGGSGIHSFRADNIDIVNNTIFNNGSTPELGWGETFANDSVNVRMYNNIAYSRTGNYENPTPSDYNNNIFFNYKSGSSVGTTVSGVVPGVANKYGVDPLFTAVTPVVHMPEGFNTATDYPVDWYTLKTANATPSQWSMAANAAAAGWYPEVNYDVLSYGYDFTLAENSPAKGAADAYWQTIAGGGDAENTIGIFSNIGADIEGTPQILRHQEIMRHRKIPRHQMTPKHKMIPKHRGRGCW